MLNKELNMIKTERVCPLYVIFTNPKHVIAIIKEILAITSIPVPTKIEINKGFLGGINTSLLSCLKFININNLNIFENN